MGLSLSNDFLIGMLVGTALVVLAQPLLRSLAQVSRFLPMLLLIVALVAVVVFWLGR